MMKGLFIILFIVICFSGYSTNYYVKNGGNNSLSGTSIANAWATLSKVASFSFNPGDSILLERGSVFSESLLFPSSGSSGSRIVLSAYGSGDLPVISGFTTLSSWTNESGSIYYASVNCAYDVNLLTWDGVIRWMARYPDASSFNGSGGWVTVTNVGGVTTNGVANTITSASALPVDPTNGQIVIKKQQWVNQRDSVTAQSGATITYLQPATGNTYTGQVGAGFFVQKKKEYLTQSMEWWYDVNNSRMYVFGNPNSSTIKVATKDIGIDLNGKSNITVENIYVEGFNIHLIFNDGGATNVTVKNCTLNYSGKGGINFDQVSNTLIQNNTVSNCLNSGIFCKRSGGVSPNALITGNTVLSTAMVAGLGLYSDAAPRSPITGTSGTTGGGVIITYNICRSAGYAGIEFQGNDVLVAYNLVDSTNRVTQDGGGIYSFVDQSGSPTQYSNRWVYKNIVINGIGSAQGTPTTQLKARGIYFDEGSNHLVCDSNTIYNQADYALYNNSASTINQRYNICYLNGGTLSYQRFRDAPVSSNNVDTANVFYPYVFNYFDNAIDIPSGTVQGRLDSFTIDNNFFYLNNIAPFGIGSKNYTNTPPTGYTYTQYPLNQWRSTFGKDINSTQIQTGTVRFQYNYSNSTLNVNLSDSIFVDPAGNEVSGVLQIPPFYSSLLIFAGTSPQPPLPPSSNKWNTGGRPLKQGN